MWTGEGRNFMPDDRARASRLRNTRLSQLNVFDALGVEMNFAMLVTRKTLEQFGKRALGAMPAINEW
jgi:hypothetical protein